jgi:hypothetical protein
MRIEFGYPASLTPVRAGLRACRQYLVPALSATGYQPESHYMRGPGPNWREKHGLDGATSGLAQQTLPAHDKWDLCTGTVTAIRSSRLQPPR